MEVVKTNAASNWWWLDSHTKKDTTSRRSPCLQSTLSDNIYSLFCSLYLRNSKFLKLLESCIYHVTMLESFTLLFGWKKNYCLWLNKKMARLICVEFWIMLFLFPQLVKVRKITGPLIDWNQIGLNSIA